ncbi:probable O-acetyltransferase CAS1 [Coccomyxa sp. Obi]|nr:probable O-acetyltransferase CAS1 [Coccomyxa sp. Obi]
MAGTQAMLAPSGLSSMQVSAVLAFFLFAGLYCYAELLEYARRSKYSRARSGDDDDDEEVGKEGPLGKDASLGSPAGSSSPREFTFMGSGFAQCLMLKQKALLESRIYLRAAVEFGLIMLWFYVVDRTTVFTPYGTKSYSRDVLSFIFIVLTIVAFWKSLKKYNRGPDLLNRQQTEEWKGWMQVLFLLYHYFNAREIYNAIRVFIAGYVWMTGYGNFMYYYHYKDFCLGRFVQMMWRLNFLVTIVCIVLRNSYMLYYICPMHTIFTVFVYATLGLGQKYNATNAGILIKIGLCVLLIYVCWDIKAVFYAIWSPFMFLVGYSDPRKPTDDLLHEWHFRSSLDRYVWIHGMLCAYLKPWGEGFLQRIDALAFRARLAARTAVIAGALVVLAVWYQNIYVLPKVEYNKVHPYTSWVPISVWVVLRNVTPEMRTYSLGIYGWLGTITLETYISQFHTWLTTGLPDGQPKMLLSFLPSEDYPLLNFALATAVYVYVSHRLFHLTATLKTAVVPNKAGRELMRNVVLILVSGAVLWVCALLVIGITGLSGVIEVAANSSTLLEASSTRQLL